MLPLETVGELMDQDQLPEEVAIVHSERDALRAALQLLPAEQRATVELQLSLVGRASRSGKRSGRSPGSVRVLRYRALQRLQAILAHDDTARQQGVARC